MKNKIRRAFDATKPNVLNRVLEDSGTDDAAAPVPPKKKKKLSERSKQFIATAASIAILFGSVFGGFLYLQDYYGDRERPDEDDGGGNYTGSIWNLFSPAGPNEPVEIEPLPTVDYDISEQGLINRARQIIEPGYEVNPTDYVVPPEGTVELVEEGGQELCIVTWKYHNCAYRFCFLAANGQLLSISFDNGFYASTVQAQPTLTPDAAAWIALLDLDPAHYSLTQYAQYQVTEESAKVDYVDRPGGLERFYHVSISHGGVHYDYYVDLHTGEILHSSGNSTDPVLPITLEAAEEIVYKAVEAELGSCYIFDRETLSSGLYAFQLVVADDPFDDSEAALIPYYCQVDEITGQIVLLEKGLPVMNEEIAAEAAAAYLNRYGGGTIVDCRYAFRSGMYSFYSVTAEVYPPGGGTNTVTVCIYEILTAAPPVDTATAIFAARNVALEQYGWTMEEVRILKIGENPGCFEIYYEVGGNGYTLQVDAEGNVLHDSGVTEAVCPEMPSESIGWKSARNICLGDCGRSIDDLIGFTWDFVGGCYWMELYFNDAAYNYEVDAMDGTLIIDLPALDGMITYEQAWEAAVIYANCSEESIAGFLSDTSSMLDVKNGSYRIRFSNGGIRWSITVDAYSGKVIQATGAEILSEDAAIRAAAEHAGCLQDYEAGTLTDVATKFDVDNGVYWVYFNHEGIYWEIEVGAYNATVYNAQFWEQDIDVSYPGIEYEGNLYIGDQTIHLIITPGKVTRYTLWNWENGEMIEYAAPDDYKSLQIFAEYLGLDTFTSGSVAMRGQLENGESFDCVVIPVDGRYHVALVDPDTGGILAEATIS